MFKYFGIPDVLLFGGRRCSDRKKVSITFGTAVEEAREHIKPTANMQTRKERKKKEQKKKKTLTLVSYFVCITHTHF